MVRGIGGRIAFASRPLLCLIARRKRVLAQLLLTAPQASMLCVSAWRLRLAVVSQEITHHDEILSNFANSPVNLTGSLHLTHCRCPR